MGNNTSSTLPPKRTRVYIAGALFSIHELAGNDLLAKAIERESNNRYQCVLPQQLLQRGVSQRVVRDQDLANVLNCDAILANYDGAELDSGTVVEYMWAKFADLPCVLLRTDARITSAQDEKKLEDEANSTFPWNLMTSFYPRTETLIIDGVARYQGNNNSIDMTIKSIAKDVVMSLDNVMSTPSLLVGTQKDAVYSWLNTLKSS